jgi:hypothetical protein
MNANASNLRGSLIREDSRYSCHSRSIKRLMQISFSFEYRIILIKPTKNEKKLFVNVDRYSLPDNILRSAGAKKK